MVHGILQLVANGWRAILHRRHVEWRIVGVFAIGAFAAGGVMAYVALEPTKATLYLLMGLVPGLVWLPEGWVKVDASRPGQALLAGFIVTGTNLTAGAAGPLLDVFFVRTALTRHQIVATKAATQVFSHIMKIVVYGAPLLAAGGKGVPPLWVFAFAIPLSMLGTAAGGLVLNRLSDVNFKRSNPAAPASARPPGSAPRSCRQHPGVAGHRALAGHARRGQGQLGQVVGSARSRGSFAVRQRERTGPTGRPCPGR